MTDDGTKMTGRGPVQKTVQDFGDQWTRYVGNEGYYGSTEMFVDILGPDNPAETYRGQRVLDIGSGSGRIVNMLLDVGAAHVVAVEPSRAVDVLRANVAERSDSVTCLHVTGDDLPSDLEVDHAVSIGVLHHIPDPDPVVDAVYNSLTPGGSFVVWLYGKKGNQLYLTVFQPLRKLTKRLPHRALSVVCHGLNACLGLYLIAAKRFPMPMRTYVLEVIGKLDRSTRYLVIYDQLNPAFAKYYTQVEARDLLERAGFVNVKLHHRHGYSWTVLGEKRPTKAD